MTGKLNKLRILSFMVCVLIVLPVFLCGCSFRMNVDGDYDASAYQKPGAAPRDAGRDAADDFKLGVAHLKESRYEEAITALKKAIALEPTAKWANSVRGAIRRLRKLRRQ